MTEQRPEEKRVESVMVYLGGSDRSFRCHCGANCFHHPEEDSDVYECNGCGEWYRGE